MARPAYVALPEAVEMLAVKPATLYTYVSRGWVSRVPAGRGRGSLYSRADLERLKARHDARAGHTAVAAGALRWGEPVIDSAITTVIDGRLYYRGHDALALAARGVRYEQVAELLFGGELPAQTPRWPELADAPTVAQVRALLRDGAGAVRALLCAVALLRGRSPRIAGEGEGPELERGHALMRWLASGPGWAKGKAARAVHGTAPAVRGGAVHGTAPALRGGAVHGTAPALRGGAVHGTAPALRGGASRPAPSMAERVAQTLGVGGREVVRAIELALIATADHELNPSTFTARVVASAGSDLYACIAAALAAMSGSHHGGATLQVEALLDEALGARRPADAVRERLARGERLPGFGHPLYPAGDPRARALLACASEFRTRSPRAAAMQAMESAARDAGVPAPNVDFGMVALAETLGLPPGASLFLFSTGRLAGWIAHVHEQRRQPDPLRPRARYTGPSPR